MARRTQAEGGSAPIHINADALNYRVHRQVLLSGSADDQLAAYHKTGLDRMQGRHLALPGRHAGNVVIIPERGSIVRHGRLPEGGSPPPSPPSVPSLSALYLRRLTLMVRQVQVNQLQ